MKRKRRREGKRKLLFLIEPRGLLLTLFINFLAIYPTMIVSSKHRYVPLKEKPQQCQSNVKPENLFDIYTRGFISAKVNKDQFSSHFWTSDFSTLSHYTELNERLHSWFISLNKSSEHISNSSTSQAPFPNFKWFQFVQFNLAFKMKLIVFDTKKTTFHEIEIASKMFR